MDGNWYIDLATGNWALNVPNGSTLVSVLNWSGRYNGITGIELLAKTPTSSTLAVEVLDYTDDALTIRSSGFGAIQPVRVTFANSQVEIIQLAFVAKEILSPVTLDEAKAFLRVQDTDDDATITMIIKSVRDWIEGQTGLILNQRQIIADYAGFGDMVVLINRPLISVDSIEYDDASGFVETLPAWRVRQFGGMPTIVPDSGEKFPMTEPGPGSVRVTLTAGYANNAEIPEDVRQAALLMISHWYDNRTAVVMGSATSIPYGVDTLLMRHRRWIIR